MSGLEQEFPGQVAARNVDATTPESRLVIERLGFRSHGLVVSSSEGEVLASQADHQVDMERVRATLRELLDG